MTKAAVRGLLLSALKSRFNWLRGLDLNQRPLGYEPNELPGCSTPQLDCNKAWRAGSTLSVLPHGTSKLLKILALHDKRARFRSDARAFSSKAKIYS